MPSAVLLAAGFLLERNDIEFNSLGRTGGNRLPRRLVAPRTNLCAA